MRQKLIEQRLAVPATDRATHRHAVDLLVSRMIECARDRLIGFYWPFKGEYDPRPVVRALHAEGVRFALPLVLEKSRPLIFRRWSPGCQMTLGIWNIPVPAIGDPVMPGVLLVPLVGFDRLGYRLGYGGGYYDRTLAAQPVRPKTIGIGFELSRLPTIYPQAHDIPMDLIVTERAMGDATAS